MTLPIVCHDYILSPLHRHLVNLIPLALAHRNHMHNQLRAPHLINQPIPYIAEFELVALLQNYGDSAVIAPSPQVRKRENHNGNDGKCLSLSAKFQKQRRNHGWMVTLCQAV